MPAKQSSDVAFARYHIPEPNSGCWIWLACLNNKGYGLLQSGGYKGYAHRYSYEVAHGKIPQGMHVCHRCDNPACVNPDHLFLGTASENMSDCLRKGRHASQTGKTQYARGTQAARSKLDPAQVKRIRELQGIVGQRKIARAFGVTKTAIREIHNRRTWNHV